MIITFFHTARNLFKRTCLLVPSIDQRRILYTVAVPVSRYALWIDLIASCWLCYLGAGGWPKSEYRVANSRGYN